MVNTVGFPQQYEKVNRLSDEILSLAALEYEKTNLDALDFLSALMIAYCNAFGAYADETIHQGDSLPDNASPLLLFTGFYEILQKGVQNKQQHN